MKEKKISIKKIIVIVLIVLVCALAGYFVYKTFFAPEPRYLDEYPSEPAAMNAQFETYFGDNRSAVDVKQLCSLVRSNNLSAENNNSEYVKVIGLLYKDSSGISQKQPNEVSTLVRAEKKYIIKVQNDKATNKSPDNISDGAESYYKNALLRVIYIEEI